MTTTSFAASRKAGGFLWVLLAWVFVALGLGSLVSMATDWANDARVTVATGILMLAAGSGMLARGRRSLRIASMALRSQIAVSVLTVTLAMAARPTGSPPDLTWRLAAGGCIYIAASTLALRWIRNSRHQPRRFRPKRDP